MPPYHKAAFFSYAPRQGEMVLGEGQYPIGNISPYREQSLVLKASGGATLDYGIQGGCAAVWYVKRHSIANPTFKSAVYLLFRRNTW